MSKTKTFGVAAAILAVMVVTIIWMAHGDPEPAARVPPLMPARTMTEGPDLVVRGNNIILSGLRVGVVGDPCRDDAPSLVE